MGLRSFEELNLMQLDALREVVNIGAGNAATALAGVLNERTDITMPEVSVIDINEAAEALGGVERIVSCVLVQMSGDIQGVILYFQELDFINIVLENLLNQHIEDYPEIDEMQESALIEIGNIIISSYVTALARMTNLQINLTVPAHCINMAGGIMTAPMAEINCIGKKVMLLDGSLLCSGQKTRSKLMLMPSVDSLNLLLQRLGVISE